MAAGEQAAAPTLDNFDLLARLLDKSLVLAEKAGEETRYRLLEPIRQYAMESSSKRANWTQPGGAIATSS